MLLNAIGILFGPFIGLAISHKVIVGQVGRSVGVVVLLIVSRVVGVGDCHELVGQAKVQMALVQVSVPVVAGVVPGWVHLAPFAVDLYGVPGVAVAGDAAVGDACCVKELGVDALVALAGALVAREAAFGRAPVEAVVVLQLVECPVVEPQRHVVFRAVCLLPALGYGVVDDLRDARAGGVVYGHLRRGAQVVDPLVVLGVVSVVVHKVEVDAVRARCREIKGKVVARGAQAVVAGPCRARRVADAFLAPAVPIGGHVHARLGLGRAIGLGYVEGRRGARGGVVPRDGEGDAVLGCRDGVGVAGLRRGGGRLGRGIGLGSEGWGGGGLGAEGWGGGAGCGGSAVSAFRVGGAGAGGCCGAVLYGICCRICVGAVFSLACVAALGVGFRLLLGGFLRLNRLRNGCHGQRRADHGHARDRAEQVVKGSFHSGASR